jgi:hypothetical protein
VKFPDKNPAGTLCTDGGKLSVKANVFEAKFVKKHIKVFKSVVEDVRV